MSGVDERTKERRKGLKGRHEDRILTIMNTNVYECDTNNNEE